MARRCTVCDSPRRLDIDRDLATNRDSFRTIADRHAVNSSSLKRHKAEHLKPSLRDKAAQSQSLNADRLLEKLAGYLDAADHAIADAQKTGDLKGTAALIRSAAEVVKLIGQGGHDMWRPGQTVNIDNRSVNVAIGAKLDALPLPVLKFLSGMTDAAATQLLDRLARVDPVALAGDVIDAEVVERLPAGQVLEEASAPSHGPSAEPDPPTVAQPQSKPSKTASEPPEIAQVPDTAPEPEKTRHSASVATTEAI